MEEDIKILEDEIKTSRKLFEETGIHSFIDESIMQKLENLIKAYKELEKNSIPKSVIREKINKLNVSDGLEDNLAIPYLQEILEG